MCKRPQYQHGRSSIRRGRIEGWCGHVPLPEEVAERVSYAGSGKHKKYPAPGGQWVPTHRPGVAECDHYAESEWKNIRDVLKAAIKCSCVQWEPVGGEFPARVWAFVNGVLHEARLSNPEQGAYHAFPIDYHSQRPEDPLNLLEKAPHVEIPVH